MSSLDLYVLPSLGNLPLMAVTTAVLSEMQRMLFAKGLAHATVRTAIGHFAEMWKSAKLDGLVSGRPHSDLVWPRQRKAKATVFTAEERDKIVDLAFAQGRWFAPQIALMFHSGMRPSEAAGLQIKDLDPQTGRVEIVRALVNHERTNGKTDKSLRSIMLDRELVLRLVRFQSERGRKQGYMSACRTGRPVHSSVFVRYWRPLLRDAGIPYRPPYAMRHTYITLSLMGGANPTVVAEFCGTSVREIERSYLSWIGAVENPLGKFGPAYEGPRVSRRGLHRFRS